MNEKGRENTTFFFDFVFLTLLSLVRLRLSVFCVFPVLLLASAPCELCFVFLASRTTAKTQVGLDSALDP